MDAAESLPDMLWSSLLWPSASYGTEPCMPADCAATFASRLVPWAAARRSNSWLLVAFDICPLGARPSTAPLGAGGARPRACEDSMPTRRVVAALAAESGRPRCMLARTAAAPTCVSIW